jgi:HK97 family phage portal protein
VVKLYVLDPNRVRPLIADDGSIFYELNTDTITAIMDRVVVPARELIHDRFNCIFHPLVGTSPIYAAGLAATQGLNIQNSSTTFFANKSLPGGILVAPGRIDQTHANNLKAYWESNFTGDSRGKIAVLGDGLKFENLTVNAEDSQLIDQLKWTAEVVCSCFHIPPYKIGVGDVPSYNNVQALNVEYYSQCLQRLIEDCEVCLDEGLGMSEDIGTEFDLDGLLRMDSMSQMEVLDKGKNTFTPNEARKRVNLPPVTGGNAVYRQQQDFSLEALAKRDAQENPFATGQAAPEPEPEDDTETRAVFAGAALRKALA